MARSTERCVRAACCMRTDGTSELALCVTDVVSVEANDATVGLRFHRQPTSKGDAGVYRVAVVVARVSVPTCTLAAVVAAFVFDEHRIPCVDAPHALWLEGRLRGALAAAAEIAPADAMRYCVPEECVPEK